MKRLGWQLTLEILIGDKEVDGADNCSNQWSADKVN